MLYNSGKHIYRQALNREQGNKVDQLEIKESRVQKGLPIAYEQGSNERNKICKYMSLGRRKLYTSIMWHDIKGIMNA